MVLLASRESEPRGVPYWGGRSNCLEDAEGVSTSVLYKSVGSGMGPGEGATPRVRSLSRGQAGMGVGNGRW